MEKGESFDLGETSESTLIGKDLEGYPTGKDVDLEEDTSEVGGNLRWAVLAMACLVMFGNYYAYDLPAALNKPLQDYMEEEDNAYQYQLNLFYALSKKYWIMHFGRIIFGVGGESLSVAQTRITAKWFKGKEIAFALGVNLSVARLGSVMNDFVSPHLAVSENVPVAIWFGSVTCFISFFSGLVLNALDSYGSKRKKFKARATALKKLKSSGTGDDLRNPAPLQREISDVTIPSNAPHQAGSLDFAALLNFPLSFWLICLIMCFMFATVVPFNTIHSAFLQSKWYPDDPKTAGQVMALPDIISAVLVPFCGTFVDRYGRRVKVLIVCGSLMAIVHVILGFATAQTVPSPLPTLMILGFSYALLLTFWPCIPLVVDERNQATAFGVATATQNAALSLFPILVAALVNADNTYFLTEMFFVLCSVCGVVVCFWLYWVDKVYLGGILERSKDDIALSRDKSKQNVAYTSLRDDRDSVELTAIRMDKVGLRNLREDCSLMAQQSDGGHQLQRQYLTVTSSHNTRTLHHSHGSIQRHDEITVLTHHSQLSHHSVQSNFLFDFEDGSNRAPISELLSRGEVTYTGEESTYGSVRGSVMSSQLKVEHVDVVEQLEEIERIQEGEFDDAGSDTLEYGADLRNLRRRNMPSVRKKPSGETKGPTKASPPKKAKRLGMLRGVFIPTFQNIVGIIVFVRFAWIVGEAGIGQALLITFFSTTLTLLTGISMCAIVTNGRVPGGGAYYMISRSLGKEFGGSVGILFYLGNCVGCAMYILGIVEIMMTNVAPQWSFKNTANDGRVYGTAILMVVSLVVATGFEVFQHIALLFFGAVVLAVVSSLVGLLSSNRPGLPSEITGFPGFFHQNWQPGYHLPNLRGEIDNVSLFDLFGVFFPAVTGVLAGSSRSGELEDPQRDIPRGTLLAHFVTTCIYYAFVLLLGTIVDGSLLRVKTALVMATVSWPTYYLTLIGCVFASLGAALQSLVSGPRLLQAMAKDHIAPILKGFQPLSKRPALFGVFPANEPRRALLLSILIAEAAILIGSLDTVTKVVTLTYLTCYVFVNISTTILGFLKAPNWRPAWKYYHWTLSLMGAIMALAFGFIISWIVSICALVAMILLFKYIEYNGAQVQWGDGLQAFHLQVAQRNLWTMERDLSEHVKNWRPHIILFVKMKEEEGEGEDGKKVLIRDPEILDLLSALKKGGGLTMLATVKLTENQLEHDFHATRMYQEALRSAAKEHKVNAFTQVLCAPSLTNGILSAVQCTGIGHLRPNTVMLGWPRIPDESFVNLIRSIINLDRALLIVKGMCSVADLYRHPSRKRHSASGVETVDVYWLVHDGGILTLIAHVLLKHSKWRRCRLRIFVIASETDNSVAMKRNLVATLDHLRIDAVADVLEIGHHDITPFAYERTSRMQERRALIEAAAKASNAAMRRKNSEFPLGMVGRRASGHDGGGGRPMNPLSMGPSAVSLHTSSTLAATPPMLQREMTRGGGVDPRTVFERMRSMSSVMQRNLGGGAGAASGSGVASLAGEKATGKESVVVELDRLGRPRVKRDGSFVDDGGVGAGDRKGQPVDLWTVHGIPRTREPSGEGSGKNSLSVRDASLSVRDASLSIKDGKIGAGVGAGKEVKQSSALGADDSGVTALNSQQSVAGAGDLPVDPDATATLLRGSLEGIPESDEISSIPSLVPSEAVLPIDADEEEAISPGLLRMNTAVKLNQLFRAKSSNSRLVLCNLPMPGGGGEKGRVGYDANEYLEYIDALTEGIPRVMLVKGTGFEVVTNYY
ncbi:hypothetical protein HDU97_005245 [Phlyctochytrium planicorne]|nr:hypothetical protein HDU97_005245 [Phlyctochytrium planicorne]